MKLYKFFSIVLSTLLIMNCNSNNDEQLMEKAKELSQKFIITDGHVDLPYRLRVKNFRLEKEEIFYAHKTQFDGFYAARLVRFFCE